MSSTSSTLPYIGSKISLISNSDIRYEGVLYTINTQESTVALQDVRSYGTEGRRFPDIPGCPEVYDFIIFRGKDIKDLTVCEPIKSAPSIHDDPAIVSMNVPPSISSKIDTNNATNNANNSTTNTVNESVPTHERTQINNRNDRVYSNQGGGNFHNRSGNMHNIAGMGGGRMGGGAQSGHGNNNSMGGGGYNRTGMMGSGHRGGYGGGGNRLYGGGGGAYRGTRHVIGELPAQPNQSIKSEMSCDFDFDEANAKFEKPGTNGVPPIEINAGDATEFVPPPLGGYDKKASFFDNISCETLDRQQGREEKLNREKQRALDTETFGLIATQHRTFRPGGFRRGGRGGRSYGYGRSGYGARGCVYNANYGNNLGGGYGGRYPGY